jgi:3D (Asp-Asp-Asp) domain-containing protein
VPFGTRLFIEKYGTCTVTDRMNRRYKSRVDIAMKLNEKGAALKFGVQRLKVQIIKLN